MKDFWKMTQVYKLKEKTDKPDYIIVFFLETVTDFIFSCSKITADGVCSHEIKRHLLLGGKAMTNLGSILKNRGLILLTKVCIVKARFFQ